MHDVSLFKRYEIDEWPVGVLFSNGVKVDTCTPHADAAKHTSTDCDLNDAEAVGACTGLPTIRDSKKRCPRSRVAASRAVQQRLRPCSRVCPANFVDKKAMQRKTPEQTFFRPSAIFGSTKEKETEEKETEAETEQDRGTWAYACCFATLARGR